jgi:hypothetical protein
MGIGITELELLERLRAQGLVQPRSSVIEIGAQQLANSFLRGREALGRLQKLFDLDLPFEVPAPVPTHFAHGVTEYLSTAAPYSRDFWTWLGFAYASIDIDGSPGSIPLDLNFDPIPSDLRGRFALVTNFGTTEHVANQLNAFQVIHDLTALGGLMIHKVPTQGYFNHGFFNYNPKLFWMLARSNGYDWIEMDYDQDDAPYELPANIMGLIREPSSRIREYRASDADMHVVVRKVFDVPFVPPIDVQTGATTSNKALAERYWSVFEPGAFDRLARFTPSHENTLQRRLAKRVHRLLSAFR